MDDLDRQIETDYARDKCPLGGAALALPESMEVKG